MNFGFISLKKKIASSVVFATHLCNTNQTILSHVEVAEDADADRIHLAFGLANDTWYQV